RTLSERPGNLDVYGISKISIQEQETDLRILRELLHELVVCCAARIETRYSSHSQLRVHFKTKRYSNHPAAALALPSLKANAGTILSLLEEGQILYPHDQYGFVPLLHDQER